MLNYKKIIRKFKSSDKKNSVQYYVYEPTNTAPRAIVQLSHGMTEYVERYEEFADFLCEKGIVFCGNDHLGHGETVSTPEDYGFFAEENSLGYLCKDVHKLTILMKKKYGDLPYFLFGHSMGSFIARAYVLKYRDYIDGLILSGSSEAPITMDFGIKFTDNIIAKKGTRYRSETIRNLIFGNYLKKIKPAATGFEWLTRDQEIVEKYAQDEKCTFVFTASGFKDLFLMLKYVSSNKWYEKFPKDLPVFIASGDRDPVGNYGIAVKSIEKKLKKKDVSDVTLKIFPHARHEILNEINREDIFDEILLWVDDNIGKSQQM